MQLSKADLKELALQITSYILGTISGRTPQDSGYIRGRDCIELINCCEDSRWADEEYVMAHRKTLESWYVNMAEELMPERTINQRAKKIGMALWKYQKLRRENGYCKEEKDKLDTAK